MEFKKILLGLFALMLVVSAAGSASENASLKNLLEKRYEQVSCRTSFYIDVLKNAESSTNVSSSDLISNLEESTSKLKQFADDGDRKGFNTMMNDILSASKGIVGKYNQAVSASKGNKQMRMSMRGMFVDRKQSAADCLKNANVKVAKERLNYVKDWKDQRENSVKDLKDKGIDISSMESVLSDVQSKIEALQSAINSNDVEKIAQAEKEIREAHLHLWAEFHTARFSAILDRIQGKAVEKGFQSDVDEIKSILADASTLAQKGTSYQEGEFEKVSSDLREASQKLNELYKKLRG